MNNTDFVLAYEQNPLIYDYIYKNGVFYKNNTGQRQYHFPEIDLSNNKLDIVNEKINDDSIVYFCMNEFESLLNILGKNFNKKHVLLADGGDGNVHNLDLPNNILHVYCPNLPFYNDKYSPFPRGVLKNNYIKGNANINKEEILRSNKVYVNFTVYNYSPYRIEDFNYWYSKSKLCDWITVKETNHLDNETYWRDLYQHTYNISSSPASFTDENKHRDTYRFWETLVAGAFPIIKRSPMSDFFANKLDLPVLLVESWDEITLDKLNQMIPILSRKNLDGIKEQYWIKKLRSHF